jgi:uncharacterized protein YbjT (DUF2867 family)
MRICVTGASGAIGSRLVPQLIDAPHDVIGTHNSLSSAELLRTLGAKPVRLDLLDAEVTLGPAHIFAGCLVTPMYELDSPVWKERHELSA